jgi:UDP-N-acetylmuramoyl-L-alanyl-D-glutamate--2,6-diaminopimelate ligase
MFPLIRLLESALVAYGLQGDPTSVVITDVTGDSRTVTRGSLFVAIPGLRMDGHSFIPQAVAQGAGAVVGSLPPQSLALGDLPYVRVDDPREALAHLCAAFHNFPSQAMTVYGVTGTDGKTTTCTLLEAILAAQGGAGDGTGDVGVITTIGARIRGAEQDTGFHVTTPDAPVVQAYLAQMRAAGCTQAIVESTSHGLDQRRVAAVAYDVAGVTNITHEHLDYHGSYEAYRAAKGRLFRALFEGAPKAGIPRTALLNRDDAGSYAYLRELLAQEAQDSPVPVRVLTYSLTDPSADLFATDVDAQPDATRFVLHWWGEPFPVETRLIGEFNVANILCAAGMALSQGVAVSAVQAGIAGLAGVLGRMERMDAGQDFLAVVDFAHSPVSLERALQTLRPLVKEGGRLIAIFGSAGLRDRAKRGLMGQVSGRLADYTIITAEDPRTEDLSEINREIAAGVAQFAAPDAYRIIPDRAEAIRQGVAMARAGDVVAAFGKGHERSMCFGEVEHPWSDQDAMLKALDGE